MQRRNWTLFEMQECAKTTLIICSLITIISAIPSLAEDAILSARGCGTGCFITTKQLSEPKWMSDGWAKVLEEITWHVVINGRKRRTINGHSLPTEQHWIFAKCNDKWFGEGFKSDGSDARIQSIYDENGNPKSYTAASNIYDRHQQLCSALMQI